MDTVQLIIRGVDSRVRERAGEIAQSRGVSMNQVLSEALRKGLDIQSPGPGAALLKFAGDSAFDPEFDQFLAEESQRVDRELWQ
ncbi:MAG: hypothetical protein ACQKBV_06550 [Puniceicoccales bacterium]